MYNVNNDTKREKYFDVTEYALNFILLTINKLII